MRFFYTMLFYVALPFIFLRLLWRSRLAPAYRERWLERLGFYPFELKKCIWIHAVSVGETIAAIPLIKELKTRYPKKMLLVTNMTPTGAARVKAVFGDSVVQAYIPYDLPGAVRCFFESTRPEIAIVMETELWPNLFAACYEYNIPLVVANARLSEKSARGYQRVAWLTREMLSAVTLLLSQGKADAERFIALGMPADKVEVTGNLKFDMQLPANLAEKTKELHQVLGKRFIWIAASTHPGEEDIILQAHQKIMAVHPEALLILVPRHPERFDAIAQLVKQTFFLARRSSQEPCTPHTQVYLADTMGELLLMYSVADVAFVGGSFAPIGGHNMLEASMQGKPVITGPHLFNFAEISEMLLSAQAMVSVQTADELASMVCQLLSDTNKREAMGEKGRQVVEQNRGAFQRQLEFICKFIS